MGGTHGDAATGHQHGHLDAARHAGDRRLRLALGANVAIVAGQIVAGFVAGSLALLSDAVHNLADVVALGLALGAVRLSRRAPTGHRSFGWHRSPVLAAQANAAGILVATGLLLVASAQRLVDPRPVAGGLVLVAATAGCAVNGAAAWLLRDAQDLGVRSALLHLVSDALASLGVAATGLVVLLTGRMHWLDPLVSGAIALLIFASGWRLLRHANGVLLEGTPRDVDPDELSRVMARVPGVESVHDLHVWSLDGALHAMSVHVVVAGHPSLEEAQGVATEVKRAVSAPFGIAHATVELECEGCADDGSWCAFAR